MMKERPFKLYKHEVQAILAGNQTQIRRVVKLPDNGFHNFQFSHMYLHNAVFVSNGDGVTRAENIACPYGQIGDQLWVRENWRTYASLNNIPPRAIALGAGVQYEAGGSNVTGAERLEGMGKFRPGMFMPRWASRIQLEITNIRVERLQDISDEDAECEGIESCSRCGGSGFIEQGGYVCDCPMPECGIEATTLFKRLWESINGPDSWTANPWVWVIEFKRVERPA